MKPSDHIKEIKAAIRKINKEGHIAQCDQYVAVSDMQDCVNALNDAFENLEGAISRLGKTIKWHEILNDSTTPHIYGEITAGEAIEGSEDIKND